MEKVKLLSVFWGGLHCWFFRRSFPIKPTLPPPLPLAFCILGFDYTILASNVFLMLLALPTSDSPTPPPLFFRMLKHSTQATPSLPLFPA